VVEVSHPNVEIFPNPASDYLQVNAHGYSGEAEIINSLGLIIWNSPIKDYQRIDISSLHGGFYFLKIKNSVYKFMVLK
jgi:hypothetical protein